MSPVAPLACHPLHRLHHLLHRLHVLHFEQFRVCVCVFLHQFLLSARAALFDSDSVVIAFVRVCNANNLLLEYVTVT